jgi:hypothetical protein
LPDIFNRFARAQTRAQLDTKEIPEKMRKVTLRFRIALGEPSYVIAVERFTLGFQG